MTDGIIFSFCFLSLLIGIAMIWFAVIPKQVEENGNSEDLINSSATIVLIGEIRTLKTLRESNTLIDPRD